MAKKKKKIVRNDDEKINRVNREDFEHLGERSSNLKPRLIIECLNCKREPDCNGCPRWEVE